ncbi:hypothetical protein CIK05_09020 [Bdellovibrio sp. qaytius]|nr:hypothetical protein CIK05_09020 [Bdellovibrio sp. qaytius]
MSETPSEAKNIEIAICSSCMVKHVPSVSAGTPGPGRFDNFVSEVRAQLEAQRPDVTWKIRTQSCFRFCPDNRITVSVSRKTTMSGEATVDSVVKEILSHPSTQKTP